MMSEIKSCEKCGWWKTVLGVGVCGNEAVCTELSEWQPKQPEEMTVLKEACPFMPHGTCLICREAQFNTDLAYHKKKVAEIAEKLEPIASAILATDRYDVAGLSLKNLIADLRNKAAVK